VAKEKFDFEAFVYQAGEQLSAGKPFTVTERIYSIDQTDSDWISI